MKMYILIKDAVPNKFVPVVAAHASLACFKKFENEPDMQTWINATFKKVVCKVNSTEFDLAKNEEKSLLLTESVLNNDEVCIVFCPREQYSKQFAFFKLWTPNPE
jgi:peptidyl-tRNA hydrolase